MLVDGTEKALLSREDIAKIVNVSESYLQKEKLWDTLNVKRWEYRIGRRYIYDPAVIESVVTFISNER